MLPVSTDSVWIPATVAVEHHALWRTTDQSVFVLPDMLETPKLLVSPLDVKAMVTAETERPASVVTVSTPVWCKTHVEDSLSAILHVIEPCVDVSPDTKETHLQPVK